LGQVFRDSKVGRVIPLTLSQCHVKRSVVGSSSFGHSPRAISSSYCDRACAGGKVRTFVIDSGIMPRARWIECDSQTEKLA
jgi:hypothetical protein